jgi:adenosine deaminase
VDTNEPAPDRIAQLVAGIPKVELHLHLEGAIPLETLYRLIQRKGDEPSIRTIADLRQRLRYTDFLHFIQVWIWKNTFIREEKDFEEIAYEILRDLKRENVKYVEAFYSPGDYRRQGLTSGGITECLITGKERAQEDFGIRCELIVDLIRDHGPEVGMERLDELTPYLGRGLIGIGLGGSEQMFPADPYVEVYEEARRRGFRLTAHAGEVVGADAIWTVLDKLKVDRIGHGLRAYEDPLLVDQLKERQIPLEMSVISNLRTGVCESLRNHPIKDYFRQGLMVTVNSDDPTMFNSSISEEYTVLFQKLGFSLAELKQLSMNGIAASFMSDEEKEVMRAQFETEWEKLLDEYSLDK